MHLSDGWKLDGVKAYPLEEPNPDWEGYQQRPLRREPVFNIPGVVAAIVLVLVAVHVVVGSVLTDDKANMVILLFSFIPAIYGPDAASAPVQAAAFWMPFTYAFLHSDWLHLGMNALWLLAFGTPVARRFGAFRFILLFLISSAGGALFHYLAHPNGFVPMIGASGAVSGCMGAASRFVFDPQARRRGGGFRHDGRAMTLVESFANPQFLVFLLVWLILNLAFGSGVLGVPGQQGTIAWQAHVGGFLAGITAFSLLEPRHVRS